jgi:DNA polymerase-3 subunit epsilon
VTVRSERRRTNPAQLRLFDPSVEAAWRLGESWAQGELLGFDLETTGIDRFDDYPVSFAFVRVRRGQVVERITAIVDPGRPIPAEATAVHGITDEQAHREGMELDRATDLLASVLVSASRRGVPVVGIKLDFDLTIIDVLCRRQDGSGLAERGWLGPALDILVLDRHVDPFRPGRRTLVDLCATYGVPIDKAHSAEADALAAAWVLLALARRYPKLASTSAQALHEAQVAYHRAWVSSYDQWRRSRGLSGLDPIEAMWPLAMLAQTGQGVA